MHVDDYIDGVVFSSDPSAAYAAWVLDHFRRPAVQRVAFDQFMAEHKLFCTWRGKRYRVTGASRLGDIWLAKDFKRDTGYDRRVDIDDCSEFGPRAKTKKPCAPSGKRPERSRAEQHRPE